MYKVLRISKQMSFWLNSLKFDFGKNNLFFSRHLHFPFFAIILIWHKLTKLGGLSMLSLVTLL
jgi:hypothetical protein